MMKNTIFLSVVVLAGCLFSQSLFAQLLSPEAHRNRVESSTFDPNRGRAGQQPVIIRLTPQQARAAKAEQARTAQQAERERARALRKKVQERNTKQDLRMKNSSYRWDDATKKVVLAYVKLARADLAGLRPLDDEYVDTILSCATAFSKKEQESVDVSPFATEVADYWQDQFQQSKNVKWKAKAEKYAAFSKKIEQNAMLQIDKEKIAEPESKDSNQADEFRN